VNATRFGSIALLVVLAGCDSPSGSDHGPPARVEIVSGDLQGAVMVKTELPGPLVVRVVDASGKPVPRQAVDFHVTDGNGSVAAGTVKTNGDGEAQDRWTLGTVAGDTQHVAVRVTDPAGALLAAATFRAVARPDVPATIGSLGAAQLEGPAGGTIPLEAVVRDQYGNAVPGEVVAWAAAAGNASPTASPTDAQGIARTQWVLGTRPGVQTAVARVVGAAPVSFTANVKAAAPSAVKVETLNATSYASAGEQVDVAVTVWDRYRNPVPGAAVQFTVTERAGFVTPAQVTTDATGRAFAKWTLRRSPIEYVPIELAPVQDRVVATVAGSTVQDTSSGVRVFAGPIAVFGISPDTIRGSRSSGPKNWADWLFSLGASDRYGNAINCHPGVTITVPPGANPPGVSYRLNDLPYYVSIGYATSSFRLTAGCQGFEATAEFILEP
jgi:hypothetical protein